MFYGRSPLGNVLTHKSVQDKHRGDALSARFLQITALCQMISGIHRVRGQTQQYGVTFTYGQTGTMRIYRLWNNCTPVRVKHGGTL